MKKKKKGTHCNKRKKKDGLVLFKIIRTNFKGLVYQSCFLTVLSITEMGVTLIIIVDLSLQLYWFLVHVFCSSLPRHINP